MLRRWVLRSLAVVIVGAFVAQDKVPVVMRACLLMAVVFLLVRDHFHWLPADERRDRRALMVFAAFWVLLLGVAGIGAVFGRPF